jgi:hypothetical protein
MKESAKSVGRDRGTTELAHGIFDLVGEFVPCSLAGLLFLGLMIAVYWLLRGGQGFFRE